MNMTAETAHSKQPLRHSCVSFDFLRCLEHHTEYRSLRPPRYTYIIPHIAQLVNHKTHAESRCIRNLSIVYSVGLDDSFVAQFVDFSFRSFCAVQNMLQTIRYTGCFVNFATFINHNVPDFAMYNNGIHDILDGLCVLC